MLQDHGSCSDNSLQPVVQHIILRVISLMHFYEKRPGEIFRFIVLWSYFTVIRSHTGNLLPQILLSKFMSQNCHSQLTA